MHHAHLIHAFSLLVLAFLGYRWLFVCVDVYEFQTAVRYSRGRLIAVLPPGRYRILRHGNRIDRYDTRLSSLQLTGQEMLTRDRVTLKISLLATTSLVDVKKMVLAAESASALLHAQLQLALRDAVSSRELDRLLEERDAVAAEILAVVSVQAAELGMKLEQVAIRDIMFPGPLKQTFAQVVAARQQGLAALERARGETAALRHLLNAVKHLEEHPSLLALRALQTMDAGSGHKLVLQVPPAGETVISTTPVEDCSI